MDELKININEKSFEMLSNGKVLGDIWFEFAHYSFPDTNWNDYAVTLIRWWIQGMLNILENNSNQERFNFMDGPFYIDIRNLDEEMLDMQFIKAGSNNKEVRFHTTYQKKALIGVIIDAAGEIIRIENNKQWSNKEINDLIMLYNRLKTYI